MKSNTPFKINILACLLFICSLSSCKKFLDAKTDKKLVIPSTLEDARALTDNFGFNTNYYPLGAQSDDDYYLLDVYYNSLAVASQYKYIWHQEAKADDPQYNFLYQMILNANVALETLKKVEQTSSNITEWKRVKGSALFFRANAFYQVAQYYAEAYNKSTASQKPGIPLRLNTDANEVSTRGTLETTWQQIIQDFKEASELLPPTPASPISRPSKAAAFASLARAYLMMDEFSLAGQFADSCLKLNNTLLDYGTFSIAQQNSPTPFPTFGNNPEVIFHSYFSGSSMLSTTNYMIDSLLYQSYVQNDMRKVLFFISNGTNTYSFKGDYHSTSTSENFNGIATDEVYLMRAECAARLGNKDSASADLNRLLIKRWKTGLFVPYAPSTADEALNLILVERRKELIGRAIRWFDLRRLNKNPLTAKTLRRKLNGQTYTLPPNDPRYVFGFPDNVISLTGIQQNIR